MDKKVAAAVLERSGGRCERCRRAPGQHLHHRCTRARSRPYHDHPLNIAHLCEPCHRHAHATNEKPWLADGYVTSPPIGQKRPVYTGTDPQLRAAFPPPPDEGARP